MPALTTEQIKLRLNAVPDWSQRAQTLCCTYKFETFLMSIAFVRRIAKRAKKSSIIRTLIFVLTK
ncbi:MAG: 4a-hydroxytetrahydrobiopterin dehydratase [Verrucomicrobiota bacterium]